MHTIVASYVMLIGYPYMCVYIPTPNVIWCTESELVGTFRWKA